MGETQVLEPDQSEQSTTDYKEMMSEAQTPTGKPTEAKAAYSPEEVLKQQPIELPAHPTTDAYEMQQADLEAHWKAEHPDQT